MRYRLSFIFVVLIVNFGGEAFVNGFLTPPLVTIDVGNVTGTMKKASAGNTVYQYLGIPYAEPPIDSLRFEPPVPVSRFQSTVQATALKPACIQVLNLISDYLFNQGKPPESEDCLYVNVFTPVNHFESAKPVMVWFFGGGNGNEVFSFI